MDNRTANALQTATVAAETEPVKTETKEVTFVDDTEEKAEVTFVDNMAEEGTSEEAIMDFEKIQEALRPYTVLLPEEYIWNEEQAEVSVRDNAGADINIDYYATRQDVFSRNQGIIEQDRMAAKQATISGLGSGGFKVGL